MNAENEPPAYFLASWGQVLSGNVISECAFGLMAVIGAISHAWLLLALCGTVAALHTCYIAFLLKIGRAGWNRRWTRG